MVAVFDLASDMSRRHDVITEVRALEFSEGAIASSLLVGPLRATLADYESRMTGAEFIMLLSAPVRRNLAGRLVAEIRSASSALEA